MTFRGSHPPPQLGKCSAAGVAVPQHEDDGGLCQKAGMCVVVCVRAVVERGLPVAALSCGLTDGAMHLARCGACRLHQRAWQGWCAEGRHSWAPAGSCCSMLRMTHHDCYYGSLSKAHLLGAFWTGCSRECCCCQSGELPRASHSRPPCGAHCKRQPSGQVL